MNGIWYEVSLRPFTVHALGERDVFMQIGVCDISSWNAIKTYGARVYAASRRQLNTKEIKRLTASG